MSILTDLEIEEMAPRRCQLLSVILTLVLGIAGTTQSVSGQSENVTSKKRAFVVGVSVYAKSGLSDLKYGAKDAQDLAKSLKSLGFEVTSLIGPDATCEKVKSAFENFMTAANRDLGKQDIILVFFSGHGLQKQIPEANVFKEIPFFCPFDCRKDDPETLISLNNVMDRLKDSSCENNILLVDACRNNPDKGSDKGAPEKGAGNGSKGFDGSTVRDLPSKLNVLFSSSPGQKSYESELPDIQQGVFTHFLLEGLKGKAENANGEILWLELACYVHRTVPLEVCRLTGLEEKQQPNLVLNAQSSIVLGRPRLSAEALLRLPPIENSIGMKFKRLPAGTVPGSLSAENEDMPGELLIPEPFALGLYEVTQSQYQTVMKGAFQGISSEADRPAIASWVQAEEFCELLSQRAEEKGADRRYRLPTEAEWWYALRADTDTAAELSTRELSSHAWHRENSGQRSRIVGTRDPNPWGFHDLLGNVSEWCGDELPGNRSDRRRLGGSWHTPSAELLFRQDSHKTKKDSDFGFRVVLIQVGK